MYILVKKWSIIVRKWSIIVTVTKSKCRDGSDNLILHDDCVTALIDGRHTNQRLCDMQLCSIFNLVFYLVFFVVQRTILRSWHE